MSSKPTVDDYLERARVADAMAVNAGTGRGKETFVAIAATWRRLAEDEAKANSTVRDDSKLLRRDSRKKIGFMSAAWFRHLFFMLVIGALSRFLVGNR